jgi:hypothetical protein
VPVKATVGAHHNRSNLQTTFHMIKAKFGQRLRSKTMTAQINEALCKVLCHNLCVVIQSSKNNWPDDSVRMLFEAKARFMRQATLLRQSPL